MKVLHVINALNRGGAEAVLVQLLQNSKRPPTSSVVVSMMEKGPLGPVIESLGVPVHALEMKLSRPSPAAVYRLWKLIKQERPDVVQCWMYHANFLGTLIGKLAGVRHIFWGLHNTNLDKDAVKTSTRISAKACSWLSPWVKKIVSCSVFGVDVHNRLGYPQKKFTVIPNGFDTEKFQPNVEAYRAVRQELSLDDKVTIIGLVARFDPQKDHRNFFQAAGRFYQLLEGSLTAPKDIHFVLVGLNVDFDNPQIRAWMDEFQLHGKVHPQGLRTDVPRWVAAFDLATNVSYGEAFPLVVGEAMSTGVPCVVTNVGDSALIVGDLGKVVPARDAEALAQAWLEMMELSSEERSALGAQSRQRIIEQFSMEKMIQQYECLWQDAVGEGDG